MKPVPPFVTVTVRPSFSTLLRVDTSETGWVRDRRRRQKSFSTLLRVDTSETPQSATYELQRAAFQYPTAGRYQ